MSTQLELRREPSIGQDLQDYTRFTGFLSFLNFLHLIVPLPIPNRQAFFTTKNPVNPEHPVNTILLAGETRLRLKPTRRGFFRKIASQILSKIVAS